jgi:succinate dehydrogenase/fumarate reductase flavoprotein subunit
MEHLFCDVLIVGSGAAGLRAAISAQQKGLNVCVISKQAPGKATCTILSAGVFAGTKEGNSPDHHLERTLQAGRGINQQDLVKVLVEDAPQRLKELKKWGINADFQRGYLYCKGRSPYLGREIVRCLLTKNEALGTRFISGHLVAELKPLLDGFFGVLAYSPGAGKGLSIGAKALILCTGGAGALYLRHDNPKRMFGDGYVLALQAGAVLQDMEFVQFYPLGLAEPGLPGFLIPPRLADHGQLYNTRGEDILKKYNILERPAAERARDRLSQALFTEIYKRDEKVFLDLRKVSVQKWCEDPFSASTYHILGERYGAINRPVQVAPMAHHTMGGVCIDAIGTTSVPGLFAAGEVTGGLHGANRMGGNALTETLVFGARAGEAAAAWVKNNDKAPSAELFNDAEVDKFASTLKTAEPNASRFMAHLSNILWKDAGIIRNRHGLEHALNTVKTISKDVLQSDTGNQLGGPPKSEILFGARVASLIIQAALKREESRGAHFREDFADQDDINWRGHLQVKLSPNGQAHWNFQAIS